MNDRLVQAKECGFFARDAGREVTSCPMFALGDLGRPERQAWVEGWDKRDQEIRIERAKGRK